MNKRHFIGLIALLALAITAGCARPSLQQSLKTTRAEAPEPGPQMLAVYQPWFGQPNHMDVGYSAHDEVNIARQMDEARKLGIEGFVVNWYGPRKEFIDKAYAKMQRIAGEKGFTVAIMYDEDADEPHLSTEKVMVDLQYAYDRYLSPHAQVSNRNYLRYQGRPVIFIFPKKGQTDWAQVRQMVNSWQDPPLLIYKDEPTQFASLFDGFYAWVHPGKKGWSPDGSNWGEEYLKGFYEEMNSKYRDKIAVGAAWPGFDDTKASWTRNRKMDPRCGKTFDDSLRMYRRYSDGARPMPYLLIVTWNDYEEGTAIERGLPTCG